MHHSEELWTDAQKFWPERFEQEEKAGKSFNNLSMNSNIISFMSLTRPSSFMTIAQLEVKIVLTHFEWDMIKGHPNKIVGTATLRMRDCVVKLRRRKRA
ncbi:hypothetical protein BC938DRAFT_483026 [Jimgerdemannia flammicorona]|uniref:Uncharacterized protein n=1 Tax=Jimgerdemannia flammicorona TaxID=994334 RepID=A0A433QW92_9FUNG|nr:hypothetical protein BC938DRAFT_483026 [Jimgerdemannia flammicorona]